MKSATILNYIYGFGIILFLYFLFNEIAAFRLRFHSLDAVIPSLEQKRTGPVAPTFHAVESEQRDMSPNLAEAISNWVRDDAYPPIGRISQPYDNETLPSPTVADVGWWGGDQE
jgi:hypothetical protein